MFDWVEWVFSGIGVFALSIAAKFLLSKRRQDINSQNGVGNVNHEEVGDTNNNSNSKQNINSQNGIGNVHHEGIGDINSNNTTYNVIANPQPISETEIKNGIKTTYKTDPVTDTESVVSSRVGINSSEYI